MLAFVCTQSFWTLTAMNTDEYGTRSSVLKIMPFPGAEAIGKLEAFPFEFHSDPHRAKTELIQRGRRWEKLAGMHFQCYQGIELG